MGQDLIFALLAEAETQESNPGGVIVGAVILVLFLLARLAYIGDVRRRRKLGPGPRLAEKEAVEDEG